jgi:hypothetical protein
MRSLTLFLASAVPSFGVGTLAWTLRTSVYDGPVEAPVQSRNPGDTTAAVGNARSLVRAGPTLEFVTGQPPLVLPPLSGLDELFLREGGHQGSGTAKNLKVALAREFSVLTFRALKTCVGEERMEPTTARLHLQIRSVRTGAEVVGIRDVEVIAGAPLSDELATCLRRRIEETFPLRMTARANSAFPDYDGDAYLPASLQTHSGTPL